MDDGIVFDTHRFIKRLVETGMDERTAEVLAEEQISLLNSNLATKFQLTEVDMRLSARISEVEAGLLKKLAELETRLLKWMVGLLVAQTGLVVTLIKLL
ncbi:hypothetical protein HIMB100_00000430 [SAR116 cluster alpha proteobacterium HIMB100]|nr:hypothetical protein HIMB100_00000430 [SAR116 cluster alpha proteobacterium HIMB100]